MPNSGHLGVTTGKAPRTIIDSSQKSEHNPEQGKIIGNINKLINYIYFSFLN